MPAILTEALSRINLFSELKNIIGIIKDLEISKVKVFFLLSSEKEYGYREIELSTSELRSKIEEIIENGEFDFGREDLYISGPEVKILICNDADVHFSSENEIIYKTFRDHWLNIGYKLYFNQEDAKLDSY